MTNFNDYILVQISNLFFHRKIFPKIIYIFILIQLAKKYFKILIFIR